MVDARQNGTASINAEVSQYGLSRRAAGDLAGAIHAFEIAVQAVGKSGSAAIGGR